MEHTFHQNTADGVAIYFKEWAVEHPKGVIAIVHGFSDHINRFDHVAAYFNQQGYSVLGPDLRGHGHSSGKRGHSPYRALLNQELTLLSATLEEKYPSLPHFLYGQSMGGALVLAHGLETKHPYAGIIASSPWIKLAFPAPAIKLLVARILRPVYASLTLPAELDSRHLSRNPEVGLVYDKDPLVHGMISVETGLAMLELGEQLLAQNQAYPLPLLIMHGSGDQITSATASSQFFEQTKGNSSYKVWPEAYHELHNETNADEVLAFVLSWIQVGR
ncbi:MAG TPA: alpha/beta hydrolase [Saprospiraceae bacterium]|nr:alpha/beta hydrolase [Saprospiraceae bacterium]HMQ83684.1 alpha/beta hydrolase [Saprospiraceae bacterium]